MDRIAVARPICRKRNAVERTKRGRDGRHDAGSADTRTADFIQADLRDASSARDRARRATEASFVYGAVLCVDGGRTAV